jgi:hypothetical protein
MRDSFVKACPKDGRAGRNPTQAGDIFAAIFFINEVSARAIPVRLYVCKLS